MGEAHRNTTVWLAHPEALGRAALGCLISHEPGYCLLGEQDSRLPPADPVLRCEADIVLLSLPDVPADGLLARWLAYAPELRLLLLAPRGAMAQIREAVRLGAGGVIYPDEGPQQLFKAMQHIHGGELWLDRGLSAAMLRELRRGPVSDSGGIHSLSPRELQITGFVAQGLNASRIAARLFLSEKTVRNHMSAIYRKLDLANQLELALYAARHGLSAAPDLLVRHD